MTERLRQIIAQNRAGAAVAIPSVCSAQPDVIRAALGLAQRLDRPIVIEATSNQVNQEGGYTGLRPADFIREVHGLADVAGVDRERITFGGDHLGPQAWRDHPPDEAMRKARVMVADYVAAGFEKIHLDCSEGCLGEPGQLPDDVTAARSADLAAVCAANDHELLFVVGTEVPPPGGARVDEDGDIPPTSPQAVRATLDAHRATFGDLWSSVGGLVVQPGVEFSPTAVHHLPLDRDPKLKEALDEAPHVCLEAHSTDYQAPAVFPRLAELGFAFQKVGPALTYAYRAALYGLDAVRPDAGRLQAVMEQVMLDDPSKWQGHYTGDAEVLFQQRHFGLADRIRYYWPTPAARAAVDDLLGDVARGLTDVKLASVFEAAVLDRAEHLGGSQAQRLIDAEIELALEPYFFEVAA